MGELGRGNEAGLTQGRQTFTIRYKVVDIIGFYSNKVGMWAWSWIWSFVLLFYYYILLLVGLFVSDMYVWQEPHMPWITVPVICLTIFSYSTCTGSSCLP